ncbi:ubiquitin-conjugating enzyme/RWD-like protein [Lasiosphaeria miniovina]|uniref:Ubiquitin-conjugating enzyme/RWD-like protein n=1 Tax=Lasiosphaeria miniovina TaxID=1954250 RepID=A0AA40B544_9PEZI|nr:ubiquitin-conjugating enzyme/RWD-like protein [Lasiosphaeria miniovina]KAK0727904.1 ubiquitin-conjugating enzyme/RWD-like protein [Lasiosphaeria miniovina]
MSRTGGAGAKQRLMSEMRNLRNEKWIHFEDDESGNLLKWRFALMVINSDSAFNGGYFKAEMVFTDDYPFSPPKFRFLIPITHPNIYPDGQLCISILHKPGEDLMSGEAASERWSPLQGAESVLRSVLLLLDDPEISSPANVDAGVMYRDRRSDYNDRARATVEKSKKDIPEGFEMPRSFEPAPPIKAENDDDFWAESDEELDFGGSDTGDEDEDQDMRDFEDEGDEEEHDGSEEEDGEDDP